MQEKDVVFVLAKVKYRDTDLFVRLLSQKYGKINGFIKGGQKPTCEQSFDYHPGDQIEIIFNLIKDKNYYFIQKISPVKLSQFHKIQYEQYLFLSYLIEVIDLISFSDNPSNSLYSILELNHQIDWNSSYWRYLFLLWAILKIVKYSGINIDYHNCSACQKKSYFCDDNQQFKFIKQQYQLLLNDGQIVCQECQAFYADKVSLSASHIKLFWLLENFNLFQFPTTIPLNLIKNIINLTTHYLHHQLQLKPKSFAMLKKFLN